MIELNKFSFRKISFLFFFLTFFMFAISFSFLMYTMISNIMKNEMYSKWQVVTGNISEQSKFSMITRSNSDILRLVKLMHSDEIKHLSIYTSGEALYSSGKQSICQKIKPFFNSHIEKKGHICFYQTALDQNEVIGNVILIVSKNKLNSIINRSVSQGVFITFLLTVLIFIFLYFVTKRITSPLLKFSDVMNKISENERGVRLKKEGTIDMQNIQETFNTMVRIIEENEEILEKKVNERTSDLLAAYKNAKGASQVKSDILKIVSHEMKTPLTSAMLFLHLMERKGDDCLVTKTIGCFETFKALIESLLDYARAVDNKVILEKKYFLISGLLDQIIKEFEPLLNSKNNQFHLINNYNRKVYSDEKLVKQILENLISNANKFTQNGFIEIKCYADNKGIHISVMDTGCGISQEDLKSVFNPFWQVDMSSSRTYEGTGLGLSICQLFTETIDGSLRVKSKINKGSEFELLIPLITNQ